MPRQIVVLFVHGIFADDPNFANPMRKALRDLLGDELNRHIDFYSIYWSKRVRDHQLNYMDRARSAANISDNKLRRFLLQGLGDAAAYQKTRHRDSSIYYEVHNILTEEIRSIDKKGTTLKNGGDRLLVFVGHSLGCHVISTYMWDMNKLKQRDKSSVDEDAKRDQEVGVLWNELTAETSSPFRKLETFAGLVTLGCNIPMFTFTFGPDRLMPITVAPTTDGQNAHPAFPGKALPPPLKDKARWLNFYSKRDLLAFPLKPLNPHFHDEERIEDIAVVSESRLSTWFPYWSGINAHLGYWTNADVVNRTADLLRSLAADESS
jgi:hypothetical protein